MFLVNHNLYCLVLGLLHLSEITCLLPGLLYFICLPSAFVLLNVYAIVNLNNISWGTREILRPKTFNDSPKKKVKYSDRFYSMFGKKQAQHENAVTGVENNQKKLKNLIESLNKLEKTDLMNIDVNKDSKKLSSLDMIKINYDNIGISTTQSWIEDDCLKFSKIKSLSHIETKFFKGKFTLCLLIGF